MESLYPPDHYDRYMALKVPFTLMLLLLYSVRHLFIIFLAYNPSPKFAEAFAFMQPLASPYFVLSDLPAMLVLAAWIRRAPQAGALMRRIWRRGRVLLTASLLLQFALLIILEGGGVWSAYFYGERERMVIVSLGLNLLAVYVLWRVPLFGDVFADFPPADAAAGSAGKR
jgi:hypothetical protein